jgi:hypothetical protein
VPEAAPEEPDVPEEPVADEAEPDDEEGAPVDDEEVVVVVVDVWEFVEAGGVAATVVVGTVRAGAPAVSVGGEDPPHAARAAQRARPATARALCLGPPIRVRTRLRGTTETSDVERLQAPSTVRAVVQVLLAQLVAPVAEAQVLDRPGQLRGRGREREQLSHDLERLAGLPVDVDTPGLGVDRDLSPGGWRPHPIPLTGPHPQPSYNRARRAASEVGR